MTHNNSCLLGEEGREERGIKLPLARSKYNQWRCINNNISSQRSISVSRENTWIHMYECTMLPRYDAREIVGLSTVNLYRKVQIPVYCIEIDSFKNSINLLARHVISESFVRKDPGSKKGQTAMPEKNHSPVFSLISQRTENKAGFILWQLRVCFLQARYEQTIVQ